MASVSAEFLMPARSNGPSPGHHVLIIVKSHTYYTVEGCAKCMAGNKCQSGVNTGLKEINAQASIPGNPLRTCIHNVLNSKIPTSHHCNHTFPLNFTPNYGVSIAI